MSRSDKALALRSACWLIRMKLALAFFSYQRVQRKLEALPEKTAVVATKQRIERVAWAVSGVGSRVPGLGNCLVQALAAQAVLQREGVKTTLRIGVAKAQGESFAAHAWLELNGLVLIGGPDVAKFTPLTAPPENQAWV